MKIAGRDLLDDFCARHADARRWIENWLSDAEEASWATPQDIKNRYSTASFLSGNTVIFNVKGNAYRLEVICAYRTGVVVVRWIGTHTEYDERNRKR
ncbi:MAG: type II toxin-antitoxin system HigB family toxin [Rhodanobacteraceae bacterium]